MSENAEILSIESFVSVVFSGYSIVKNWRSLPKASGCLILQDDKLESVIGPHLALNPNLQRETHNSKFRFKILLIFMTLHRQLV